MNSDDLVFPVMSISGKTMVAVRSADELARGTKKAVTNGYFDEVVVVDSAGNRISLSGAKPQIGRRPFVYLVWRLGFPVTLGFETSEPLSPVTLDGFKETICKQLDRDKVFWGSVGVGYSGLKKSVETAPSFREVISLFI